MDKQDALAHAPNSPHWDNLPHYRMVEFSDIVEGKYYYFKRGNFPYDFIVIIHDKFNNRVKCEGIYWRLGPLMWQNAEYISQWGPVPYIHDFDVSLADMNDQAPLGQRKFYVYDEDVVMEGVMEGGMRRGSLLGKKVYGLYKDGSDIYKDRTGYYIVQWNKRTMRPYKKHIKGFKPNLSRKTRKVSKKRGKKTRRNH